MSDETTQRPSWFKRIGWLILIWSASVLSLTIVAYVLRKIMTAAGMTT